MLTKDTFYFTAQEKNFCQIIISPKVKALRNYTLTCTNHWHQLWFNSMLDICNWLSHFIDCWIKSIMSNQLGSPCNCLFADLIRSNHSSILWLSSNSIKRSMSGATRLSTNRPLSLYSVAWNTRHVLIGTRSIIASLTINLTSSCSSSISPRRQFRTFYWFEKEL